MRTPALLLVTGLLGAAPALAAPNPRVEEARKLIDDLEVEAAVKVLDAAEKTEGNEHAVLVEILTLQGIAWGTLGKDAKTRDAFRKLLMIAPEATLPPDQPPRVRTPFLEAREWTSSNGPLTATPGVDLGDGLVRAVKVSLDKDVLRLARSVRFHLKLDGADQLVEVPVTAGRAVAPVGKASASWWAEVLSERKAVLLEVASAAKPREEWTSVSPVAAAAVPEVSSPGPVSGGWRRPTGVVLLGAGAVAAGVGVVMGLMSSDARARVANAPRDDLGRVTGLTQREAAALETTALSQATVANVLFGVGGGLAAAGVVLIILGPSGEPAMALAPAPGGVVVSGSF
ncbi:MAG: hypothetical protein Q8L48_24660 [Archangium sp.]|nr:hypothetical protein [Archangium sp.]